MSKDTHTADIGDYVYDIIKLRDFMATLPIQELEIEILRDTVSEDHDYWLDKKGQHIGPYDLLKDWDIALQDDNLSEHVEAVKNADIDSYPIWICNIPDKQDPSKRTHIVIDGVHRLTKAFLEGRKTIKYQLVRYEDLPQEARVKPI